MKGAFAIEEKDFPEMTVLKVHAKDRIQAMGKYIGILFRLARTKRLKAAGKLFSIYHEKPEGKDKVDYEICLPVEGPPEELDKLEDMGGDRCLYLRLPGSYSRFGSAYSALEKAAEDKELEFAGPPREVYVRGPLLGFMTFIPTMVTDIYFPIRKRAR
jgi:effector-binding domain-containing protein